MGVSGYTARPPEARQKPKVSAFINAKFDKIMSLEPDLVLTFSDLQAEIARELIARGVPVMAFNQRSVSEILEAMLLLGRMLGCESKAQALVERIVSDLDGLSVAASRFPFRPTVFFEEWKDPMISGIQWVEELVEVAGGQPVFPELRSRGLAKDRIVSSQEVIQRNPEVILASWCGLKVNKEAIRTRPGWEAIRAVQQDQIHEIKSTYILQPGPAALTEGVQQIHAILSCACGAASRGSEALAAAQL